jgi:hypothetical protein
VKLDGHTQGAYVDEGMQTSRGGIFAAGNVLHVHDLVDFVSIEAEEMADAAAKYLREGHLPKPEIAVCPGENVGHVIPQAVTGTGPFKISLRVRRPMKECRLVVTQSGRELRSLKLHKAVPAEMLQLQVPGEKILPGEKIEVSVI